MAIGHQCTEVRERSSTSKTEVFPKTTMSQTETIITRDRLRQQLMKCLDETGWQHRIRLQVQDLVHEKGIEKATIEDIVQELAPKASSTISDDIKKQLIVEAKHSLKESDYS